MLRAVIGLICLGFSGYSLATGRIYLGSRPIYRVQEPFRFWVAVGIFGFIGLVSVATSLAA